MASAVIIAFLILLKFWIFFVNCVVRQVHVQIIKIDLLRWLIFVSSQSAQPFVIKVYSHRINSTQHYVNPQIKLQLINKKRFVKVSLNNVMLLFVKIFQRSCHENTFSLAWCFRLTDESFSPNLFSSICSLFKLSFEISKISWQQPCLREKLIVFGITLLKSA